MNFSVNVYGASYSVSPDIVLNYSLNEYMEDGKWKLDIKNNDCTFKNELIPQLTEETVKGFINHFIDEFLSNKPEAARKWFMKPELNMRYDDELSNVKISLR